MTVRSIEDVSTRTIRAPSTGAVRLSAPRELCGELEVFDAGEVLARVGDVSVLAPARGFVVRTFVRDGEVLGDGAKIAEFRLA